MDRSISAYMLLNRITWLVSIIINGIQLLENLGFTQKHIVAVILLGAIAIDSFIIYFLRMFRFLLLLGFLLIQFEAVLRWVKGDSTTLTDGIDNSVDAIYHIPGRLVDDLEDAVNPGSGEESTTMIGGGGGSVHLTYMHPYP